MKNDHHHYPLCVIISIPYIKVNKDNTLMILYCKLESPKEKHFVMLFIAMHSIMLILIISKH